MRPLTDTLPKPLLPIADRPIIEHHILRLVRAGIRDIVINHAYLGDLIEQTLGDGSRFNANITYSPEAKGLETGGGIFNALSLLGEGAFLVVNGDIWCDYPFASISLKSRILAHLILVTNPKHNRAGDFSIAEGLLSCSPRTLTYSGIGIYHPDFFKCCQAGVFPLAPLLREAATKQRISAEWYQGHWFDIGTPERLSQVDTFLKS
ncbi:Glucose-1-phosphate thymidylyltransferase [hydrothermal vent metagenome]|uniref:Glucose-1-phosphate thymidylyltransferase n=1 Tax=hydrothermal vent metagenome TaxID=652676 RepID=A0A3B0Z5G3_9ZZZZ